MKDEVEYFKEIHLMEDFTVTLTLAGLADDRSRFAVRNEFFRTALHNAIRSLQKTKDFQVLASSLK